METTRCTVLAVFLLLITNLTLAQRGNEGAVVAPAGATVVNTYTYLTADVAVGASTFTVNSNLMTGGAFGGSPLAAGDLLMIIQMQGVSMDINITPISWPGEYTVPDDYIIPDLTNFGVNPHYWGQITNYNNSGLHERVEVLSVSGANTITLNCNTVNAYTSGGHVQVIRVPRYSSLTINAGSSFIPTLWNGNVGGVVAIEVDGALTLNAGGSINADAAGFRGGAVDPDSFTAGGPVGEVRYLGSYNNLQGSRKGEGIGGYEPEYAALFSEYGIGAPANGGGGGGYQNTGGGGGCNVVGSFASIGTYTGKGNPIGFSAVWDLESPGFGGSTEKSGGRGGYAYSNIDANELAIGPRNVAWGGDDRKTNGGFGGHPLPFVFNRFWAGGGGGAGDQDSDEGGAGGRGGGIVFLDLYGTTTGAGTISANGEDGQDTNPTGYVADGANPITGEDGAGGGGAGGSVHIVNVGALPGTLNINVDGGDGGDQVIANAAFVPDLEAGGPGGSGSGGYVRITSGAPIITRAGGANGVTTSTHMVNFPPNGATAGSDGIGLPAIAAFNLTLTDVSICPGGTANLTAVQFGTAAGTVTWYDAMVGGSVVTTGLNYVTPPLFVTTTYWVGVCPGSFREPVTVTVLPPDDASFNYSAASYCASDVDQAATITGLGGGGFTIVPAIGLPINAGTGFLSVNGSTPGVYTVTYTTVGPCPNSSDVIVTITALDNAGFNYSAASYCSSEVDQAATITGEPGGSFTILPAIGLPINGGTGFLSVNGATPGVYTVTYTTLAPCSNTSNVVVTITALDNAGFNYSAASYCAADADQAATITGEAGGGFTILPAIGLPINAGTGFLSVNGATPGVYTVTYTTLAPCSNTSNVIVTITAIDDASFNYSAAAYCVNDVDQAATITGEVGGGFTILPAVGLPINAGTGFLSVNGATPGVYTVTYTTLAPCSNTSNVVVTINAMDNAAFNYSAAAYCVNDVDQAATITGLGGGGFTILPAVGLPINAGTGFLSVNGATPGVYTVTYTTVGPCPSSSNVVVTINAMDNAGFNYSAAAFCVNDVDQAATITGLGGGGFTILPAIGLPINAGTGFLSVNGATPGVYTVTYTTAGTCPNSSNVVVTINALDNASFNYSAAAYCVNDVDQAATITGLGGGGFTILPAIGLPINAGTGFLSVNGATPGVYTATYTTAGTCPNTSNVIVTINALDNAAFNYSAAAYCVADVDQAATITGLGGGGFTILPAIGLPINTGTGFLSVNGATPGVYTVTYTTVGACPNSSNVVVTITALDNAGFNYSAASYCAADPDQAVTITGEIGGGFTILPAVGLPINAGSGLLSVNGATPGVYTVTYTTLAPCSNTSNVVVTITALDNAAFNYSAAAYCVNDVDQAATITGEPGGGFTILPAVGLPINAGTGFLSVNGATPGVYTVTYTTLAPCSNTSNVVVTINAMDNAGFNYSAAAYCPSDIDQAATITGLGGGGFTILPAIGLPINAGSGLLSVNGATPGVYTVTYTTAGTCPNTSNVVVTINTMDNAVFNYSAAAYCPSDVDQAATITGLAGGGFTILPAVGLPINAGTGFVSVNGATPGVYTVTYTTVGTCPNSSNVVVTINAMDNAAFNYSAAAYCTNALDQAVTITGLGGGGFTILPAVGLPINAVSGLLMPSGATPGAYTITYTTVGTCPNSSNVVVTINAMDNAAFNYSAAAYCPSDVDQAATITGLGGGGFTILPAVGLPINAGSGLLSVNGATPGVYTVTYTTTGTCPNTSNVVVTINALDNAAFNFSAVSYCVADLDQAVTVTGLAGGSFSILPGVGLPINAGTGLLSVNGATPGVYTITYTTAGTCPNSSNLIVTILAADITAFTTTPTCDGGTSSAPATAGGTFTFAIAPLDGAVIDPITGTVTGGTSGATYSIEYTTLGACGGNSIQPVTVLPNPVITPIADLTVCDSYPLPAIVGINLSGNEAYYNNSQALGGTVISGSITTTQTIYIYDANGACSDETSFVVTINITEDASFTLTDYCDGAANVALITGTAGGTFAFNPAVVDGATVDAVTGAVTSGVPGTTYSIEYTTSGACPASSIEQITVFAFPVAPTVSGDQTYCASEFMNDMTATGGAGSLTWYDDFGLSNVIGTGGTQTPYSTTGVFTYYVTETENGCEGLESSIVITIEDCDVLIPTAFTPDGDGANDDWELQNIDNIYPNNVVKVYNRWGNLLFESAQGSYDTNRWDGTFKGNLLPVASYYYIIEPNADGAETMTGSVSIILN